MFEPLTLVKQEGASDCGVACLQMVCRQSRENIITLLGRDPNLPPDGQSPIGIPGFELQYVLWKLDMASMLLLPVTGESEDWKKRISQETNRYNGDWISYNANNSYAVIVGVPSKNVEDQTHWIVWSRGKVYDPSRGRVYKEGEKIDVIEAIFIR